MNRIEEIEREIDELNARMDQVEGTTTEVYTRIVGYYRSVRNWNRGKREEYGIRKTFALDSVPETEIDTRADASAVASDVNSDVNNADAVEYMYFYRTTCPNCPPVKSILEDFVLEGEQINVDEAEGFEKAQAWNICSSPTVIFLDNRGEEVTRAVNVDELKALTLPQPVLG